MESGSVNDEAVLAGKVEKVKAGEPVRAGRRRDFWPGLLIGLLTLANGLGYVFIVYLVRTRHHPVYQSWPMPFGIYELRPALSLVAGFSLIYISAHLLQRHRAAWWAALGLLIVAFLTRVTHHSYGLTLVTAATIALLVIYRKNFRVASEPRSMTRGLGFMAASLLLAVILGASGFWLLDLRDFGIDITFPAAVVRTVREFILIGNNDLIPHTRYALIFPEAIRFLGLTGLGFALFSLFRPLAFRLDTQPAQRVRTTELLLEFGAIPEHYYADWPDKSHYFLPDSSGVIAYRAAAGVALGLGDPICPPERIPEMIAGFQDFCAVRGWKPALVYARDKFLPVYLGLGMRPFKIGADAVVDLQRFLNETSKRKEFRKFERRFDEKGYTTHRYIPPLPAELIDELERVSRDWLNIPGHAEHSFVVGAFSREYVNRNPVFAAMDGEGKVAAFVSEAPSFQSGVATIDMMRHLLDTPPGMMDYLFTKLFRSLAENGFQHFNMGMAPMLDSWGPGGATVEERVVRAAFMRINRFSYAGLTAFKQKYDPVWEDRFMVYPATLTSLTKVAIAISRIVG